jgi:hypothetical protein
MTWWRARVNAKSSSFRSSPASVMRTYELYTLNETGQAICQKLDGQRTLKDVAALLAGEFNAPLPELENAVVGFASEMTRRGILVVSNQ